MKFRHAAFVYLHVSILYEAAAYEMWRASLLPFSRLGPPTLWLVLGAIVALVVFVALLRWQNVHFTRAIWALHALRLPPLIHGAFLAGDKPIPPSFYITAIVVVVINLWMLARAAWDL
jgi:peptidoglycan/LPS O-acetylase OafA/YrhL